MRLSDLLGLVEEKWWREFLTFVESGEASDEFLTFLDSDERCQKAVEAALQIHGAGFARASRVLRSDHALTRPSATGEIVAPQSRQIAEALEAAIEVPADEREAVVRQAVAAVRSSIGPDQAPALRSVVNDLEKELANA